MPLEQDDTSHQDNPAICLLLRAQPNAVVHCDLSINQHPFKPLNREPLCIPLPSPGIYAQTNVPLLNLTLATLRSPEFGFFGFTVVTRKHTPFSSGLFARAGDVARRAFWPTLHPRITWL
jgi:hypothetical protein